VRVSRKERGRVCHGVDRGPINGRVTGHHAQPLLFGQAAVTLPHTSQKELVDRRLPQPVDHGRIGPYTPQGFRGDALTGDVAVQNGLEAGRAELNDNVIDLGREFRAGYEVEQELLVLLDTVSLGDGYHRMIVEGAKQAADGAGG